LSHTSWNFAVINAPALVPCYSIQSAHANLKLFFTNPLSRIWARIKRVKEDAVFFTAVQLLVRLCARLVLLIYFVYKKCANSSLRSKSITVSINNWFPWFRWVNPQFDAVNAYFYKTPFFHWYLFVIYGSTRLSFLIFCLLNHTNLDFVLAKPSDGIAAWDVTVEEYIKKLLAVHLDHSRGASRQLW
jgi:hypothetical protein